jgi:hypothetical protein
VSKGNSIIVTAQPKGTFLEGFVSGTPLPGHNMQIKAAVSPIGGEMTWEAATPSGGDGKPALIAILLEDSLQGKGVSDAYVSGTRCFMYCPVAGEDMNVRVGEGGGTSNALAIGDLLMSDAEDGIFIPNSSGGSVPFQAMEVETLGADDTLIWCKYTGH